LAVQEKRVTTKLIAAGLIFWAGMALARERLPLPRFPGGAAAAGKFCDPVCELKSQDAAFTLLVEVYRQHQAFLIESDYQVRLQYLRHPHDSTQWVIETNSEILRKIRDLIAQLALQERDYRLAKMETQVANFQAAYSCVRKLDEDAIGEKVPKNQDPDVARSAIKNLVVLSSHGIGQQGVKAEPGAPASTVLHDPLPGPTIRRDLVEPCE
jgi:hypothetical protein